MLGAPFVIGIFGLMLWLRSRKRLTFELTAALGTLAMFLVLLSAGVENGRAIWKAALGALFLAPIAGLVIFGFLKWAGLMEPPSE
jgi:hypothetical protein